MTWKELKQKGDKYLDDNDIIDYFQILNREDNELDIEHTSRGYSIISHRAVMDYKHHNDPAKEL